MTFVLCEKCDVVVGLAIGEVFDKGECDWLADWDAIELIDASNNFDTKYKLRCGKWTRTEIIKRINDLA